MHDLIRRRAAIKAIDDLPNCYNGYSDTYDKAYIIGVLEELPSAVKHGRWGAKTYYDATNIIKEWQSCKCSVCGRYDTRPYLYYFSEPNFCSWCGAKMDEVEK